MSHQKVQPQHVIMVFIVYAVLIFMILALINYMIFPMYIFSLLGVAVVVAAVATFFHVRGGNRSEVDDIADKFGK